MADWAVLARFTSKFRRADSGCWEWTGALNNRGYGSMRARPVNRGAHVWSYELFRGPIPSGMEIDHLCRVRHCVNPDHLEAVTHAENTRRGMAGRVAGSRAGARKAGRITGDQNLAKTHCTRGHAYDDANTYITPSGGRACRECQQMHAREWMRVKREGGRT